MEVKAKGKYIQISPRKTREVISLIKGKNALEALDILRLVTKKSALPLSKVLKSAIANAENNFSAKKEDLYVLEVIVNGGPILKRYQPRAQGRIYPIKRRTSHIEIVLSGTDLQKAQKAKIKLSSLEKKATNIKEEKKDKKKQVVKESFKEKEGIKEVSKKVDTKEKGLKKVFRRKSV